MLSTASEVPQIKALYMKGHIRDKRDIKKMKEAHVNNKTHLPTSEYPSQPVILTFLALNY